MTASGSGDENGPSTVYTLYYYCDCAFFLAVARIRVLGSNQKEED